MKAFVTYIFSFPFLSKAIIFATVYLFLAFLIYDFAMISNIIVLPYPIILKIKVLFFAFLGFFSRSSELNAMTTLLISILFGINSAFIFTKTKKLSISKNQKRLAVSSGFLSIATVGCTACGLSLLSVLGVGGVLSILPFKGYEFSLFALGILLISLYSHFKSFTTTCAIPVQNS